MQTIRSKSRSSEADALDRKLTDLEIREVVLALQLRSVIQAGGADVNADDAGIGAAERILGGLPRSASGDEDIQVGAIRSFGPQQVVLGAMAILVLPLVTSAIQVGDGGRIGMAGVELAHRIGVIS